MLVGVCGDYFKMVFEEQLMDQSSRFLASIDVNLNRERRELMCIAVDLTTEWLCYFLQSAAESRPLDMLKTLGKSHAPPETERASFVC